MPPAGSPPVILTIAPCFEKQGNISAVEPATYLYYIADAAQPAVAEPVGALRRGRRRPAAQRLPRAVGDQLPRRPVDRGDRLHLPERRHRQADQVRHRGAAADQDRRLHGQQAARVDEDRREAEGRERHHPPRLVRRRRADPPRQGRSSAACCPRRDISTARSSTPITPIAGGTKTREPDVHHQRRPEVQDQARSTSSATRTISDGKLPSADEGDQGAVLARPASRSSGTYKEDKYAEDAEKVVALLPRQRLPARPRRQPGSADARGQPRTARPATSSCASRSPKARATRSATSRSPTTRWSSPRRWCRSSS